MSIEVRDIKKSFGSFTALNNVNFQIGDGELLAILGPSGSGKTTLLRIIAGLEFADPGSGGVWFDGQEVTNLPVASRKVGFAFQHYALFRHLTVFENVAFGLRVRPRNTRPSETEIRKRVRELLELVQLEHLENRRPAQLSGGQRQRVALARALAVEPKVLLLDEPFGALDAKVRKELRRWLRQLHEKVQITSLFVTHDQDEALEVASRVVVMNNGQIEQIGTPTEVYDHPASQFVYHFLGTVNLFHGRFHEGKVHFGESAFPAPEFAGAPNAPAIAYVRPHEIRVLDHPNGQANLAARIRHSNSAGPLVHLELERQDDGALFSVELSREQSIGLSLKPGSIVFVELKKFRVFSEDYSI